MKRLNLVSILAFASFFFVASVGCGTARPSPSGPATSAQGDAPKIAAAGSGEPKAKAKPMRETLAGAVELLITLLEAKDYRTTIEQFVKPEDKLKIRGMKGGLDGVINEFSMSEKPVKLLKLAKATQGTPVEMSEDDNRARYPNPSPDGGDELIFRRIDGQWYIDN